MKKLTKTDYFAYIGAALYFIMFIQNLVSLASNISSSFYLPTVIIMVINAIASAGIAIMLISKKRNKIYIVFPGILAAMNIYSGFSGLFHGGFISILSILGMASSVFLFIFVLKNYTQPTEKSVGFNIIWFLPVALKIVQLALSVLTAQSAYSVGELISVFLPIAGLFFLCYWIKAETDKLAAASAGDEFDSVPKK